MCSYEHNLKDLQFQIRFWRSIIISPNDCLGHQALPQILELWGDNMMTDVTAKKGLAEVIGK